MSDIDDVVHDKVTALGEQFDPEMPLCDFLNDTVMMILEAEGATDGHEFVVHYRGSTIRFQLRPMGFLNPMFVIEPEVEEARPRVN